jgi:hypothetical protein
MKRNYSEILESHYELSEKIPIDDLGTWLNSVLFNKKDQEQEPVSKLKSALIAIAIFGLSGFLGFKFATNFTGSFFIWCLGFIGLIVFHELIHGAAYKYFGAPRVGFGFSTKSGMVYAYANKFVIDMDQFKVVALAPFVVISFLLVISMFLFTSSLAPISLVLFMHTFLCYGDFTLAYYAYKNPKHLTFDDLIDEKAVYFYKPKGETT